MIDAVPAPFLHIVCCIDDSDASRLALDEARRLRAIGPGRLTVLHAYSLPSAYMALAEGMSWLPNTTTYASAASAWLKSQVQDDEEAVVVEGHAGYNACQWSEANGADLMVAAAHRGLAARVMLGSFAGYLAYHAPCSVLLVRPAEG